jgi:hypothetical protein
VNESATKWQKPQQGQKDGEACDDLGIDEAGFGSVAIALIVDAVKVVTCDTSYNGCKGELKKLLAPPRGKNGKMA